MISYRFDFFHPLSTSGVEFLDNMVQVGDIEWWNGEDFVIIDLDHLLVDEKLEPLNLYFDTVSNERLFWEVIGKTLDFAAVTAV